MVELKKDTWIKIYDKKLRRELENVAPEKGF